MQIDGNARRNEEANVQRRERSVFLLQELGEAGNVLRAFERPRRRRDGHERPREVEALEANPGEGVSIRQLQPAVFVGVIRLHAGHPAVVAEVPRKLVAEGPLDLALQGFPEVRPQLIPGVPGAQGGRGPAQLGGDDEFEQCLRVNLF